MGYFQENRPEKTGRLPNFALFTIELNQYPPRLGHGQKIRLELLFQNNPVLKSALLFSDYNGFRGAAVPVCPISHTKPRGTRRHCFFPVISVPLCGIIKKILIISDYDGFGGTLRICSDSHREPFSAPLCDF
ncbi:MAG: hypothetical protein B6245_11080 [Desulfobacteraceae bacterium 4572_88]|nr:MAG: hypothetical protein B6245_11080 [Desulfobacteraceae bacterium 4572_88]